MFQQQWFVTTQGASIYGIEPEGGEEKTWAFTSLLRDLVFGFPSDANLQEWREWVEEIYRAWTVTMHRIDIQPGKTHSAIGCSSINRRR